MMPSTSSDDILSTPFWGRKLDATTSNPATGTQCTGPALIVLPVLPPGTNLAKHVKETLKVDV